MSNCTTIYNSKEIQTIMKKMWEAHKNELMQKHGGLPPNEWSNYRNGFKKGFIESCKKKMKSGGKSRRKHLKKRKNKTSKRK